MYNDDAHCALRKFAILYPEIKLYEQLYELNQLTLS